MSSTVLDHGISAALPSAALPAAEQTRRRLGESHVFSINLVGGPGCGKSVLIEALAWRLREEMRVGVIACDGAGRSTERSTRHAAQLVELHPRDHAGIPDAVEIHDALPRLDLRSLEVLFVENVGTRVGPVAEDLGQNATVAIFSVAAGHDKAAKHAHLVRQADAVVLNKTDLLRAVPFDIEAFRQDVHRLNPDAPLFEVSSLRGEGIEPLVQWLRARRTQAAAGVSEWFG